jgi:EAL domain-containing protein (putative c-di-GMP-specific phosphodiesterase class I)
LPLGGTAARLGGNEFGVLWSDDESSVIQRITAAVNEPVELAGITVGREVAIGMATRSPQLDQPASLLRAAEIALHAAKDTNRSIVVHSPVLDTFDADRLALASELRRALDGDELALHYQPKVDLDGGHVHSFEALVRWNHPQRGMIMPDEFVPLAESTSLITALTTWVIEAAAEQLARWDGLDVSVSINVSAHDFAAGDLADRLLRSLQTHRVDPGRLGIEITETAVVADPAQAGILLRTLRKLGVAVSLDDFGQGATSLASLATLPFTELKVDRSFVTGLADNPIELAIVSSLIDLGHRLGLTVTAEGIEDERSAELLRAMGCDHGQGYRFARAMAAEAVPGWLAQQHVLADLAGAPGQV